MARRNKRRTAKAGQGIGDKYASARRSLNPTWVDERSIAQRKVPTRRQQNLEKAFDANHFIYEPARKPPEEVRQKPKAKNTKPQDVLQLKQRCKANRPDPKKPSKRGKGNSRAFVPWCQK